MVDIYEEQKKVMQEFKEKIKALPVAERKQAAMLAEIFTKILEIEAAQEKHHDEAYKTYNSQIGDITTQTDQLIEGSRKVKEEELEHWKKDVEPELTYTEANNTQAPLKGYWKAFIIDSEICKVKRPWRKRR